MYPSLMLRTHQCSCSGIPVLKIRHRMRQDGLPGVPVRVEVVVREVLLVLAVERIDVIEVAVIMVVQIILVKHFQQWWVEHIISRFGLNG